MEFDQVIRLRQSVRAFTDEPLTQEQIEKLIAAGTQAPVGSNMYKDIHITVVEDQKTILTLCEAAWERFSSREKVKEISADAVSDDEPFNRRPNLFYDAPVVFFVSHRKQTLQPGIEWANTASVVNQMHLAATDMGLGSVYMWGALESMRMIPELDHTDLLDLPENFEPLIALAVGNPKEPLKENTKKKVVSVNYVR